MRVLFFPSFLVFVLCFLSLIYLCEHIIQVSFLPQLSQVFLSDTATILKPETLDDKKVLHGFAQ